MNPPLTANDSFVITNPFQSWGGIPVDAAPAFFDYSPVTAVGAVSRTWAFDLLDLKNETRRSLF
jgi:hypothetical protein